MTPIQNNWFHDTVSALAYSAANEYAEDLPEPASYNDLTQFILAQHARMPSYLRAPLMAATLGFDALGLVKAGQLFHRQSPLNRSLQIKAWKNSKVGFKRDLIRYFESLALFEFYSRPNNSHAEPKNERHNALSVRNVIAEPLRESRYEVVVIGSGPGGAITACLLAEAGRKVLLIEEGDYLPLNSCAPFTRDEMVQKYRNGGQTVAMGANKVSYVEGRCVGGGSEINSGLYHRTPLEILDIWRREFEVEGISQEEMRPHFEACEKEVSVSHLPGEAPAASLKLHHGATKMGWKSSEIPRWFRYDTDATNSSGNAGKRQSMTETFVPRFLKAGGQLLPRTRVYTISKENNDWMLHAQHAGAGFIRITGENLFVCAGAVQTPALLRRSGITRNIGDSLRLHPTVKVVARFPDVVNSAQMGVPVHQVKEFAPRFSFGCSISAPPHLALALLDHPSQVREVSRDWPQMATYYAMITGEGRGNVRTLPGARDPLVRYKLTESDRRDLGEGLCKLCLALFAGGADALYPAVTGCPAFINRDQLGELPNALPNGLGNLMTIHLFSSCPMGEDRSKCATDSYGRVHGFKNLFVSDASLLCTAPGVNPQGSIMAFARRNAMHFQAKV